MCLLRIWLVFCGLVCLLCVCADDVELLGPVDPETGGVRIDEPDQRRDAKIPLSGSPRRQVSQPSANATRDSQLLSVLAARRRQLLHGRLAAHINTLASLTQKSSRNNTTFAQLEVRDANNTVVKKIIFDNSSNEAIAPTLKIVTNDGTKEIKQDVKPHEIRHLFIPKVYHDNSRVRAGFINNRRKNTSPENVTESNVAVFIPPEKLEGLDKEIELDPEEEFQVDESNHGLYLLNYSDTDNVTKIPDLNKTTTSNETKETTTTMKPELQPIIVTENITDNITENEDIPQNTTTDSPTQSTKLVKLESDKDKVNNTLFMSDELYNHFRPLETELPVEDMAPFIYFGQKLGGPVINDNLTNPPLSASTKSVNYIMTPQEKRKFNSRYSATEKYKNSSVDEEEVNEDMDVSVVKNIIEKNKVRNTVKGPAPPRHVGLVNAYRKYTTTPSTKSPNVAELNVTEAIINITPATVERNKDVRMNETTTQASPGNSTEESLANGTIRSSSNKVNVTTVPPPRNYTRTYHNLRRRPARLSSTPSTETLLPNPTVNATTEKASTLVYTAVVTSVSITSSVKGQNKTDGIKEDNSTLIDGKDELKPVTLNETETTPVPPTYRPYKHRIRIRTTTTESTINQSPSTSLAPEASELSTRNSDLQREATASRISERLANLYRLPSDNSTTKTKNILRRRRPTTTSTTLTVLPSSTRNTERPTTASTAYYPPTYNTDAEMPDKDTTATSVATTQITPKPSPVVTSPEPVNDTATERTFEEKATSQNEEVVIEAGKTYTASYVLAGLGFLPVAAIIAFVLRSVFHKKTKELDTDYEGYFDDPDIKKESPITPVARPPLPPPSKPDQKWEFPRNKLRLQTLLGQGNFGQVWKAEADDLTGHDGLTRLVAVKSIKETASQKEKQELLHEICIMQKIGTHPNVVTLLACCTEQEPYLLIMEYVMCGKLLTYLRERRSRPDRFGGSGALTSRDLTVFAYCVARGMDYIASKGIVHRDLAARNVLVDHNKLCKIADFGMSRAAAAGGAGAGGEARRHALPVRWMAPEALLYNAYNHETDVWAFGILLWEIVTLGSTPYAAMSGREVLSAVTEGYRLERPPHCKPQLYRAMHSCWHADPTQRPTFASLKSQLAELLDNEPSEGNYVDLDSFYQESSVYSDPSAIIQDDDGLSAEYDRERRVFRELAPATKYDNRAFNYREEDMRSKFGIGTPRMGGFGIRDVPFNDRNFSDNDFGDRQFPEKGFGDRQFSDKSFGERPFVDKNFNERSFDSNFVERKDGKLSTSSFHRERERENPLVSRNSFSGFPRLGTRDGHFQILTDGRNNRVSEFECDI